MKAIMLSTAAGVLRVPGVTTMFSDIALNDGTLPDANLVGHYCDDMYNCDEVPVPRSPVMSSY